MAEPLSRELAQRVVDQVSPTLEHNINVMDRTGIIIASSDPSRVGMLHAEAARAAASGREVIVHAGPGPDEVPGARPDGRPGAERADRPGAPSGAGRADRPTAQPSAVRPGVNIPLLLDGGTVGVVGLTGDPGTVGPIAQVLVLAITLLLERDHELDAAARREARDRELLSRLVGSELGTTDVAAALDSSPGRVRPPWRLLAVIGTASLCSAVPLLPAAHPEIARALERLPRHRWAAFGGVLWILGQSQTPTPTKGAAPDAAEDAVREATRTALRDAVGAGEQQADGVLVLASESCPGPEELCGSAVILAALVAQPRLLPPAGAIRPAARDSGGDDAGARLLRTTELAAELAVGALPATAARHLARKATALNGIQRETAWAFLESGQSVSETARRLFTHRNTVLQRLERIGALTGLDPRDPQDALTLRLALVAVRG